MPAGSTAGVGVPPYEPDGQRHRRNLTVWAQWINKGHLANTGSVTLATGTTTTTVTDERVSSKSMPILQPATANALSAYPTVYVSTIVDGAFTITHANSASSDKTFRYALLG